MVRSKKCAPGDHDYRPLRGGKHEKCTKCNDVFPCRHDCEHWDCIKAREGDVPEVAKELMLRLGIEMVE